MRRVHVGSEQSFDDGDRRFLDIDGNRVGVFRVGNDFVAYRNVCAHQGGPVCEGQYFPRVKAEIGDGGVLLGERLAADEPHLVCPWHGWEYDLRTGEMAGDPRIRLHRYTVVLESGEVYVEP